MARITPGFLTLQKITLTAAFVKHTLVLGASLNPSRYSNICIHDLIEAGFTVSAVGLREGIVSGVKIEKGMPQYDDIHTITLYLGPGNQPQYYEYIIGLNPKRLIFNPGTWNEDLADLAAKAGIRVESRCTLMMISAGNY